MLRETQLLGEESMFQTLQDVHDAMDTFTYSVMLQLFQERVEENSFKLTITNSISCTAICSVSVVGCVESIQQRADICLHLHLCFFQVALC